MFLLEIGPSPPASLKACTVNLGTSKRYDPTPNPAV